MAKGKKVKRTAKATKKKPSPTAKPKQKAPAKKKAVMVVAPPPPAPEPCSCGHDHGPVEMGPAPAPQEGDWRSAFGDVVDFLRYMDDIVRAIGQQDIPPEEFITLLKDLDELGLTMKYLDVETAKGLGPDGRKELFKYFISDVFIKKMRVQRELDALEAFEVLKVQELENRGPLAMCDYPLMSRMLLGLVQTVIAAHLLTARGGTVESPDSEDDLMPDPALLDSLWAEEDKPVLGFTEEDLAEGLWNLISPFDMLKLTSTAVMAYLTWRDPRMAEDIMVEGLATLTPPVFILMACTDALDALTRGLVTGRPLLRKVQDDGTCSKGAGFHFVLTEEGQNKLA
jgi:hypothetical protein